MSELLPAHSMQVPRFTSIGWLCPAGGAAKYRLRVKIDHGPLVYTDGAVGHGGASGCQSASETLQRAAALVGRELRLELV